MRTSNLAANLAAFVSAILFGASVVAVRVAVQEVSPLSLAVLRFGQGALILLAIMALFARRDLLVARGHIFLLVVLGAIGFGVFPLLFNIALQFTEASHGALILATAPLMTAILARAITRERLSGRQLAGTVLAFAGVAATVAERVFSGRAQATALMGDGLMLCGSLCGAFYYVMAKRALLRNTALAVTAYTMAIGTLVLLPLAVAEGFPAALRVSGSGTVLLILFLGVAGGALGYFLTTFALTRLLPTQGMVYINLNPLAATVLGALFLGERLTPIFVAGFAAVAVGVLLVNWPGARPNVAEPLPA